MRGNLKSRRRLQNRSRRLWLQPLETRRLLAFDFTVNTLGDLPDNNLGDGIAADINGDTSLRAAIQEANAVGNIFDVATITFDSDMSLLDVSGTIVIQPQSALPTVTAAGTRIIVAGPDPVRIDGSNLSGAEDGIRATADMLVVEDIQVSDFPGDGIELIGADNSRIERVHSFDNGGNGIRVVNSGFADIRNNQAFSNSKNGIQVTGAASGAIVHDNLIGAMDDGSGPVAAGNSGFGLHVLSPGVDVRRNVIGANSRSGLVISNTSFVVVDDNHIGVDTGLNPLPNGAFGVLLTRANDVQFGTTNGNVVEQNSASGVVIATNSVDNEIKNNSIRNNNSVGLFLRAGASQNEVADNNIDGNAGTQVLVDGASTTDNVLTGNIIGNNFTGGPNGILVKSPGNTIGNADPLAAMNVVTTPPGGTAITLSGINANGNLIQNNQVSNANTGIRLTKDAANNQVIGNLIMGNAADAIQATTTSGVGNLFSANAMQDNGFGIDLAANGLNANDAGDGDAGANNLQNSATAIDLTAFDSGPFTSEIFVEYFVDSDPANSAYPLTIEFFGAVFSPSSTTADATVQGEAIVGSDTFTTADFAAGSATHIISLPVPTSLLSTHGTATITDANGNTSEFTAPVPIEVIGVLLSTLDVNQSGNVSSVDALLVINALNDPAEGERAGDWETDVNRDGKTSAADALKIINFVNDQTRQAVQSDLLKQRESLDASTIDEAISQLV